MKQVGDKVLIVRPHPHHAKKWMADIDEIDDVKPTKIHLKKAKKHFKKNGKADVDGDTEELFPFPDEIEKAITKWKKKSPFAAGFSGLEVNELALQLLTVMRDNVLATA
jgi:hypothetical protein